MKSILSLLSLALVLTACNAQKSNVQASQAAKAEEAVEAKIVVDFEKIEKSEDEWKKELTDEEFYILREKGTERAFTGTELLNNKKEGTYVCAGCELPLFTSDSKFKSGTGWPSFFVPIKEGYVAEEDDTSYGMLRTEVVCGRCDGHLGHVFNDGPKPTGLRYCINAISLDFQEAGDKQ